MIVQLTGTLVEVLPSHVVIDVGGVGYELGVSATTAASLPAVGEAGVTVLTRMLVKENSVELYGFATREERAVFDKLVAVSGVGPKLALAVLSTFSPATLAPSLPSRTRDAWRRCLAWDARRPSGSLSSCRMSLPRTQPCAVLWA
jgi:Holliday junction DNA helicase RuvA